jgi:predicted oxidoreductase
LIDPPVPVPVAPGGVRLSRIVAGTWRMLDWGWDAATCLRWIEQCVELGVTSFDHADIYGDYRAEALFGEALAMAPGLRERLQIVGKFGIRLVSPARPAHRVKSYDSSRAHLFASVDASLRALRTDRLELLLLHRPDLLVDPDDLADALRTLVAAGKVLHFGVSNHSPSQLELLRRRHPVVVHQLEFSALQMRALADGTLDQCLDLHIRPMAWSPLGGGRLMTGHDAQAQRVRSTLEAIGREHGVAPATVAYAWLLRHPAGVLPVAGTRRIEALAEAVSATALRLPAEDWYRVWQASIGHEVA